jgi:lipoate-protein ligase B
MIKSRLKIKMLGLIEYDAAMKLQAEERKKIAESGGGTIYFLEHPPVITLGRHSSGGGLLISSEDISSRGISLRRADRGGDATAHEPGQLVVYFIIPVRSKKAGQFVENVIKIASDWLREDYSLENVFDPVNPGLWINGKKICSAGFDLRGGISSHGIAINISNDMSCFKFIRPCRLSCSEMTSMSIELGRHVDSGEAGCKLSERYAHGLEPSI